jgi:hypothetical protein
MLYTVGKRILYDLYMARDPNAAKGVSGAVWETLAQAKAFRDKRASAFGIYGVYGDWSSDTKDIGSDFHVLTRDCKLIAIDEDTGEPI